MTRYPLSLVFVASVAACSPSTDTLIRNTTVSTGPENHISLLDCVETAEVAHWASLIIPLLIHESGKMGYGDTGYLESRWVSAPLPLKLCAVEVPAPCCQGGYCARPCEKVNGALLCGRKAGCAARNHAWVSIQWPPVCADGEHPAHCAAEHDENYNWRITLVHEIGNVLRLRYFWEEGYTDKEVSAFFSPDGPVRRVQDMIRQWL